jgi:hypothetical protein
MKLEKIISIVKPNFFMDKNPVKPYQTVEDMEGNKSSAIYFIVGLSSLYNIPRKEVMEELDIDYDEYRKKLSVFNIKCEECNKVEDKTELTGELKRFYLKFRLISNAIKLYNNNQAISIKDILSV